MKVREIMTEPVLTCTAGTSLAIAARLMRDADYGTLPVVDSRRRLVGIITDRDICLSIAASQRSATNISVHETMTTQVLTAAPDDDVRVALSTMQSARVRRLPVCDGDGHLEGILSIEDIVMRGLEDGAITSGEIIAALRAMCVRVPVAVEPGPNNGFMPG